MKAGRASELVKQGKREEALRKTRKRIRNMMKHAGEGSLKENETRARKCAALQTRELQLLRGEI